MIEFAAEINVRWEKREGRQSGMGESERNQMRQRRKCRSVRCKGNQREGRKRERGGNDNEKISEFLSD